MYQAVLFDLDGTLIDSADDLGMALNYVLAQYNLESIDSALYRTQASNGTIELLKLGFGEQWHSFTPDKIAQLKQSFLDFYQDHLWCQSQFYPGITKLISYLDVNSIPWSIVTNKPEHLTLPLIKQIPEFNNCHNIISGDTLTAAKPSPLPILHSCQLMQVDPKDCLYIGDDQRDVIAGNSAGMKTAVALWGYLNGCAVSTWQADLLFNSPQDLYNHISSFKC